MGSYDFWLGLRHFFVYLWLDSGWILGTRRLHVYVWFCFIKKGDLWWEVWIRGGKGRWCVSFYPVHPSPRCIALFITEALLPQKNSVHLAGSGVQLFGWYSSTFVKTITYAYFFLFLLAISPSRSHLLTLRSFVRMVMFSFGVNTLHRVCFSYDCIYRS